MIHKYKQNEQKLIWTHKVVMLINIHHQQNKEDSFIHYIQCDVSTTYNLVGDLTMECLKVSQVVAK